MGHSFKGNIFQKTRRPKKPRSFKTLRLATDMTLGASTLLMDKIQFSQRLTGACCTNDFSTPLFDLIKHDCPTVSPVSRVPIERKFGKVPKCRECQEWHKDLGWKVEENHESLGQFEVGKSWKIFEEIYDSLNRLVFCAQTRHAIGDSNHFHGTFL